MRYVLSIFFVSCGMIKANKKKVLSLAFLFFMFFLAASSYGMSDYDNYKTYYEGNEYRTMEIGWFYLNNIFRSLGFSFIQFRALIIAFHLCIVYKLVQKCIGDSYSIYVFYFLYPFLWDVVQLRTMLASSFFLLGFPYLVKKGWKNDIRYILLILLAGSMQAISLWFLVYIIGKHFKSKRLLLFVTVIATILGCMFAYSRYFNPIVSLFVHEARALRYMQDRAHLGVILGWMWAIIPFMIFLLLHNRMVVIRQKTSGHVRFHAKNQCLLENDSMIDTLFNINCLNIFVCVFFCISGNFSRIIRIAYLLNYIYITYMYRLESHWTKNGLLKFCIAVASFAGFATLEYIGYYDYVVKPFMANSIYSY